MNSIHIDAELNGKYVPNELEAFETEIEIKSSCINGKVSGPSHKAARISIRIILVPFSAHVRVPIMASGEAGDQRRSAAYLLRPTCQIGAQCKFFLDGWNLGLVN